MPSTTAQKLRIRENDTIRVLHAPGDYEADLEPLPAHVRINSRARDFQQLHWFVRNRAQVEKEWPGVSGLIKEGVLCWIFFPKGSSGIQTDLTRDKGWDQVMKDDLQWVNLVSFNATWSAFGLRQKTDADKKKETRPKERAVLDFVDPLTKTVTLPADLSAAFQKHKKEFDYFHSLAFSHKREYIEWIVSAKKEETRAARIQSTIERLGQSWKNPSNR